MSVARVQNGASGANAASVTVALGSAPTAGNLLVAWANSDALVTIGGTGWTAGPVVIDGNGAYAWWKVAGGAEPSSVVFTPSVPDWIVAGLLEYSGLTGTPFDTSGSSMISGTPSTSTNPVTVTTAAGHELGVALAHLHSGLLAEPAGPSWTGGFSTVQAHGMNAGGSTIVYTFAADNLDLGTAGSKSTAASWTGPWPDCQELLLAFTASTSVTGTAAPASASAAAATGTRIAHGAAAPASGTAAAAAGTRIVHGTAAAASHSATAPAGYKTARGTAHPASASAAVATPGGHSRLTLRPYTGTTPRP